MSRERERFDEIGKKMKREMIDASNNSHEIMGIRTNVLGGPPPQGSTLNTITPCAACKLLRRRCAEECPFSPYFSPHEPQNFAAVHKVFGASNVSKLLLEVPEGQRADAANSLVYEANVRLRDPVYGCMGAILALQQQVQSLQSQLNAVTAEILKYKHRNAASNIIGSTHAALVSSGAASVLTPSPPPPSTPPPQLPPPPPSTVVSSCSTTLNSFYTSPATTRGYISSPSDTAPYFD